MSITYSPVRRDSNIELLRIILMLLIVMHHSLLYSTGVPWGGGIGGKHVFAQFWSMWGKMAVNAYIIITGYFMCERQISFKKFFRLLFQIKFWDFTIFGLCVLIGIEEATLGSLINVAFKNCKQFGMGFIGTFLFLFLLIPYLNVLIKHLCKKEYMSLITLLIVVFTGVGTFLCVPSALCLPFWYVTMYLIGAMIRKYPYKWMSTNKICMPALIIAILVSFVSVVLVDYVSTVKGCSFGRYAPWYMVFDANKPLALGIGILMFLVFRNMRMPNSKMVNCVASASFGVLLIHDSSLSVRIFIWRTVFHLDECFISSSSLMFVCWCLVSVVAVYCVATLLELLRIHLFEKVMWQPQRHVT